MASLDDMCGDEVEGSCIWLRSFIEAARQGYVLRVPPGFRLTLATYKRSSSMRKPAARPP